MAKIAFTKLNAKVVKEVTEVVFNGQVIEVKKYLPIEEKIKMVEEIVNLAVAENRFQKNPVLVEVYETVKFVQYYTNISFTDAQKNDILKLYDSLVSSGLLKTIIDTLSDEELNTNTGLIDSCLTGVYSFNNSVRGVLGDLSTDYSNLQLDAEAIKNDLAENSEEILALKDILTNK